MRILLIDHKLYLKEWASTFAPVNDLHISFAQTLRLSCEQLKLVNVYDHVCIRQFVKQQLFPIGRPHRREKEGG